MQDISALLQEAKPLYIARKRRRNICKTALASCACAAVLWLMVPNTQIEPLNFYWEQNLASSETNYIESLGLPVDDYGLLLVS